MAEEKSEEESASLEWPPRKEDLERLYGEQRLSAAKIAKVYGLKYASPKTAESTILHHLKKNEISRRGPAEHIRKITEEMVDNWVARYQNGESLKDIANDTVSPVTVFNHLHKRGLELRDKVEAQIIAVTIHPKQSFHGSYLDVAYHVGLSAGDFGVVRHGRAIRAKLSTTHPAMSKLFRDLFEAHGPIYEYPRLDQLAGYEWSLDCDLDSTFEFLSIAKLTPLRFVTDEASFWNFLAGFFDAEGSIQYHRKRARGSFELTLTNASLELLREIGERLRKFGVFSTIRQVRTNREKAIESGIANPSEFVWRLVVWRYQDVNRLLNILPLRHAEKVSKAAIAVRLPYRAPRGIRNSVVEEWNALLKKIEHERQTYIEEARIALMSKKKTRQRPNR